MSRTKRFTVNMTKSFVIFAESSEEAIAFAEALASPDMGEIEETTVTEGPIALTEDEERDLLSLTPDEDEVPSDVDEFLGGLYS